MPGISFGTNGVEKVGLGSSEIVKVSRGDTLIWEAVTFKPSGMIKSGTQALSGSWAPVTGWEADPAYPGSTVVNAALAIQGAGVGRTVSAAIPFTGANKFGGGTVQVRILQNGAVIGTGTGVPGELGTASCTVTDVSVVQGDAFSVQVIDSNPTFKGVISAGSSTFVRVL